MQTMSALHYCPLKTFPVGQGRKGAIVRGAAEWDVEGYFVLIDNTTGAKGGVDVRVRCYEDGYSTADLNGITVPIWPEMTASAYFDAVFRHMFGSPDEAMASGD